MPGPAFPLWATFPGQQSLLATGAALGAAVAIYDPNNDQFYSFTGLAFGSPGTYPLANNLMPAAYLSQAGLVEVINGTYVYRLATLPTGLPVSAGYQAWFFPSTDASGNGNSQPSPAPVRINPTGNAQEYFVPGGDPWATAFAGYTTAGEFGNLVQSILQKFGFDGSNNVKANAVVGGGGGGGSGSRLVNQDYPTVGAMTILDQASGQPIVGAMISVVLQSDAAAGNLTGAYVQGYTTSTTGGMWASPIALNPGLYNVYVNRPHVATTHVFALTVT